MACYEMENHSTVWRPLSEREAESGAERWGSVCICVCVCWVGEKPLVACLSVEHRDRGLCLCEHEFAPFDRGLNCDILNTK